MIEIRSFNEIEGLLLLSPELWNAPFSESYAIFRVPDGV
jgi:hypothetical protein